MLLNNWSVSMGDLQTRVCRTMPADSSVGEVLARLKGQPGRCIGLTDGDDLVGIVSAESVLDAVSPETFAVGGETALSIASTSLARVSGSTTLGEFLMDQPDRGFSHIVVSDEKGRFRIVLEETRNALLRLWETPISDVAASAMPAPTLDAAEPCVAGLKILSVKAHPYIVVTEEDVPSGIVSRKDITDAIHRHADLWTLPVSRIARREFLPVSETDSAMRSLMALEKGGQRVLACRNGDGGHSVIEPSQLSNSLALMINPLIGENGSRDAAQGTRRRLSDVLIERAISDTMNIGVIALSPDLRVYHCNGTAQKLLGFSREEVHLQPLSALAAIPVFPQIAEAVPFLDAQNTQVRDLNAGNGLPPNLQIRVAGVWEEAEAIGYIVTIQDSTDVWLAETKLRELAYYDTLTGLPNRTLLFERLSMEIKKSRRRFRNFAVAFVDLDGFKAVNDNLGHCIGDALLTEVAARFSKTLRGSDTVARFGGDEFVFILPGAYSEHMANVAMTKALASLSAPFELEDRSLSMSASFGFAFYPHNGATPEDLIAYADAQMYTFKRQAAGR